MMTKREKLEKFAIEAQAIMQYCREHKLDNVAYTTKLNQLRREAAKW